MRRAVFMIFPLCLLLCGCGAGNSAEVFYNFSAALRESTAVSITASVRYETGQSRSDYKLSAVCSGEESVISVLEPETIAGVQAKLRGRSTELEYNSVIIDAPLPQESPLSPVTALPMLTELLKNGFPESCGTEGELLLWQLVLDDDISALVFYSPDQGRPVRAELRFCGFTALYIDIIDWQQT